MKLPRGRRAVVVGAALLALVGAATVGWVGYDGTPDPPDVKRMTLGEAMQFEASEDYLKLSERKRRAFTEGVLGKLRALPFEEMLRIALDPSNMEMHRRRLANLRTLPDFDALHSRLAADFLEKFYELPAFKRSVYLTAFAYYQEIESRVDPARYETPAPGEFHADAVKLFSSQSPTMKAYAMQFMIDLRRQRQRLGLRDLPIPMK